MLRRQGVVTSLQAFQMPLLLVVLTKLLQSNTQNEGCQPDPLLRKGYAMVKRWPAVSQLVRQCLLGSEWPMKGHACLLN